jgi:hypothetical protein
VSKLLDVLEAVGEGNSSPLGFDTAARQGKGTPLACVGILRRGNLQLEKLVSEGCLSGVLLVGRVEDDILKALGEIPWGVWTDSVNAESLAGCREKGCDFVAARPEHLEVNTEDDIARFVAVGPDLEDRFLRTIEELPVDGVLLTLEGLRSPITVQHLMVVGAVRTMFEKHLLLEVPPGLGEGELAALRDMGVAGIAVELEGLSPRSLKGLGRKIDALAGRQAVQRKRRRSLPYIPSPGRAPFAEEEEEEGEF